MNTVLLHQPERLQAAYEELERLGLTNAQHYEAIEQIASGKQLAVAISGKLASGKDFLSEGLQRELGRSSSSRALALALKHELSQILALVSESTTSDRAATAVAQEQGVPLEVAREAVQIAQWALEENPEVTGFSRSKHIRTLLVYWARDGRRCVQPDYWIKRALVSLLPQAALGKDIYVSDMRHHNEAECFRKLGFSLIRVDVTKETQRARLKARDGLEPDPKVLESSSEVELISYPNFSLRVSNDGPPEEALSQMLVFVKGRLT